MDTVSVVIFTAAAHAGAEAGGAFVKVDGRECLLRSVELFLNRDNVKQIQLVVTSEQMEEAKRKYGGHLGFTGVKLVSGGPQWMDQLAAATPKVSQECSHVIVHDAARPIVAFNDLEALFEAAAKHAVVYLAYPARSPLAEVEEGGEVVSLHPASRFLNVVTPWAIKRARFEEMARSKQPPSPSEVYLLRSSSLNQRVNTGADAALAKSLVHLLPKPKIRAADNPFDEAQW